MADDGDVGGFLEVPELETGEFVDYYRTICELVEDVESRGADVAYKISVFTFSVEEGFNE